MPIHSTAPARYQTGDCFVYDPYSDRREPVIRVVIGSTDHTYRVRFANEAITEILMRNQVEIFGRPVACPTEDRGRVAVLK
jgi:hypothetical protein